MCTDSYDFSRFQASISKSMKIKQKHEPTLKMGPPEAQEHEKAIRLESNMISH